MQTRAVRLHGEADLRLDTFELPEIKDDEILVEVISDSICMSSYKAAIQGTKHKRVPQNIGEEPIIIGHEFSGNIVKVGSKYQGRYKEGNKFATQPAINYKGSMNSPGYSYPFCGGSATYCILPQEVMAMDCLLDYSGDAYYAASLAEPMSCIIGGYHAMYHTSTTEYVHKMDIVSGGKLAIIAGAGPMGLGAIDYAIHRDIKPALLVVTDIDDTRLSRAQKLFTKEEAEKNGIELHFVNTKNVEDPVKYLRDLAGGDGYDDVLVFAPVKDAVQTGDQILGRDGCMNFFAGPTDVSFSAEINMYNVHYGFTHILGTTGGTTNDMIESIQMTEKGLINPAVMVTHIGGIDCVADTTIQLPKIPGGKKLTYNHIEMPLTALDDLAEKGKGDERYKKLAEICEGHKGLWNAEAEKYLLNNF